MRAGASHACERPFDKVYQLYIALLDDDVASPFLPKSDEETVADGGDEAAGGYAGGQSGGEATAGRGGAASTGGSAAATAGAAAGSAAGQAESETGGAAQATPTVTINFDNIARRIVDAPDLPARNYTGLREGPEGTVFVAEVIPNEGAVLHKYTLDDAEADTFLEGFQAVQISHDRKKLLYRRGSSWNIVDTARPPGNGDGQLSLGSLRVRVEPEEEWAQMLRDGWRFMRDFLYVDNQHGAPWDDIWDWYSAWLPDVRHRSDFNQLLDMLSGEIAVGHSYVRGGDYPELDNPRTGLLGIDLEEVDGRYRLTRIYTGEDWTPNSHGPLSIPGMGVEEGDYLLAIDGREVGAPVNPYELLEGTAGRTITVSVSPTPSMDDAREVVVEPVGSEAGLRHRRVRARRLEARFRGSSR